MYSNRKTRRRASFLMLSAECVVTFCLPLLLLFALMFIAVSPAAAADKFCSDAPYFGVIDGNVLGTAPVQITIDTDCTFKNWPQSNPLTTTVNFQTNDPSIYLIVFDNVWYDGNMACSNIPHKLWVVNSEEGSFSGACQNVMIPAETIYKRTPAATATIGLPFTYRLTIPAMNFPVGEDPSPNDLGNIEVRDDLRLAATGVSLTVQGTPTVTWKGGGPVDPATYTYSNAGGLLTFSLPHIAAGQQIVIDLTVVLDDNTTTNVPGKQFTNTATWQFSRWIDLDEDWIVDANEFFNPLPGESGISAAMTIVTPNLAVNKTSPATALNLGDIAVFTIDVQNSGGGDAWNATIEDQFPAPVTFPTLPPTKAGMCPVAAPAIDAEILASDGTLVKQLVLNTDYTISYSGCRFILELKDAAGPIEPGQHLIATYQTQLDSDTTADGATLTNVAGATRWYSANSTYAGRRQFTRTLTDGTPGVLDFQDNQTVTAGLHGYYFEKIVQNLTSLANPAATAAPGDTLRYRMRVFNVDQTINAITINDTLNLTHFDPATFNMVTLSTGTTAYTAVYTFNPSTGLLQITGTPALDVKVGGQLQIEFDIRLRAGLTNGTIVSNQASLSAAGGFTALSDDPNVNGVAAPDDPADPSTIGDEDSTDLTIQVPGPLTKANTKPTATIGERFEYTITVPAVSTTVPLYDVQILDTLPANLRYVSTRVITGGAWNLTSSVTGSLLIIEDAVTGIDIPANGQARIGITVELLNSAANQSSVFFNNSASYTYNRANGGDSTKLSGAAGTTANMTVTEPLVTAATKTVRFVSPASKAAADPATVGDVLEYRITVPNSGSSTAFDANIADTLPANVALVAGAATAAINGAAVTGFIVNPSTPSGTTLVWGRGNGDGNLDIPAGQTLVLTYQVTVVDASSVSSFTNSAYIDWTSLDGDYPIDPVDNPAPGRERTGAGCPATALPNDYCTGPASITVYTADSTSIVKSVQADSYAETPPGTADPIVRVGDTVTYDLTVHLQEYTTRSAVVQDVLPAGMELQSFSVIGGANFSYTLTVQPVSGATGTLRWEFGDIINTPDGSSTDDALVVRYVAKVLTDAPPAGIGYGSSILLDNRAKLSYTGGDPASANPQVQARLNTTERIEVRQPQMQPITKVDLGAGRTGTGTSADPYHVNLAADVMMFQLKSCNNGLAPAYNVHLTDTLAGQLNEAGMTTPVVAVGASTLSAGADYTYTYDSANRRMDFVLGRPVDPGQCVTIDYTIGFHTDITAGQTWSNQARLSQYSSLPANGRLYAPTDTAQVWMTNQVIVQPLSKTLTSAAEATIGNTVTYQITVPGAPMNTLLANVMVSDTLHAALEYLSAAATLNGSPLTISTLQSGQTLTWSLGGIPAGRQAIITVTARVANNAGANAGVGIINTASYTYTDIPAGSVTSGSSGPLTIVEPSLAIAKSVNPTTPPSAGDILHYTVSLTAASGAGFSTVYDAALVDTLSMGLVYVTGTARVGGATVEPAVSGDGLITSQTLTWGGTIDIPEGTNVSVTYDARVLAAVVAGQTLTNSAKAQWTGIDGANGNERNGSGTPAYNDYFTGAAATSLTVSDNNSLTKTIFADTYVDASSTAADKIARIGDTASYRLTLKLGEGTTNSVKVRDVLPPGMAYDSLVAITPASGSGSFTYSVVSQPTATATGTLTWDLGNIVNTPSNNNTPFDALTIEYKARVLPDAGIAHAPAGGLQNTATLSYVDAGGTTVVDPNRLESSDTLLVRQPVMSAIVKSDRLGRTGAAATPLNVNVATDVMQFRLQSCNTSGLAPAYSVQLTDVLPSQLKETSITPPVVAVGGLILAAGSGYTYAYDSANRSMNFVLNAPVNPGQCVTVDYNIGFSTDFGPNQIWSNSATLNEYWSLPAASGQKYVPTGSSQFFMTNQVIVAPLSKSLLSPAEATIGEAVTYRITVPGTPVNAALNNVVITDTLDTVVTYVTATVAAPFTLTDTTAGQNVTLAIAQIPAGQQAVITLTARLTNNDQAQAGTSTVNTASYTYTGIPAGSVTSGAAGPLTIVEPSVTATKSVNPTTPPAAGDILTYTVTLTATAGANYSSAFDTTLVDTLSAGLAYVDGTARVGGAAVEPAKAGQTLTWSGIDIPEGATVIVTYNVTVLDTVTAGQVLNNSVTAQWTGIDGTDVNERTGADGIGGLNDYAATAAAQPLIVPIPALTLQKIVDKPVANPGDTLHYTIVVKNPTGIGVNNFSLVDEVDRLNAMQLFQGFGTVSAPTGTVMINGGTLMVTGLHIVSHQTLTIEFDAVLRTDLKGGTVVLNQAELQGLWPEPITSDDPNMTGSPNPTQTVIPANGVVYDAASRKPLGGVTVTMRLASTGNDLPASCFIDPSQQNQVTPADGTYKFDVKFNAADCPENANYLIAVAGAPAGYVAGPSLIIVPASSASTPAYSVPLCSNDAVSSTTQCEAQTGTAAPAGAITTYYLLLTLNSAANQIFNNHIPVDPYVEEKISITKKSPVINVTRGQLVPYTITVKNTLRSTLPPLGIVDTLPPGFKYVEGSCRYDETPLEPVLTGRELHWDNITFGYNQQHTIKLLLVVGAGVSEGEYVNRAHVINAGVPFSEEATATVRVVPDPTFDCTDVIGKVFDDRNLNGYQDTGETGLAGVRVVTARGLIAATDEYGRYHITCAAAPDEARGSNFILKLDDRTLPTGYRVTTENPRVQRATAGKMLRFNFGAAVHHVVSMDIADGAFEPKSANLRMQWRPRIDLLLKELRKAPSVLRLSYLAEVENPGLVEKRLKALKKEIAGRWDGGYQLTIETEVFWRNGSPR